MRRKLFLSAMATFVMCCLLEANGFSDDSAKVFDSGNKRIIMTEDIDKRRVDVEVFELNEDNEYQPFEKIFEGRYQDGKSSERRKYLLSIDIPSPVTGRGFSRQYESSTAFIYGFGRPGFTEKGDSEDIPFRSGKSIEFSLTAYRRAFSLSHNHRWNIIYGLGIRWVRYHLKGNHYFKEKDNYTYLMTASDDLSFKKSKLGITSLNVPLLLEWKTSHKGLYMSVGGVCSFNTASSSRIYYVDEGGHKRKEKMDAGMTLRPVTFDILVQVGTNPFRLFGRNSLVSLFEKNKGPELYPYTIGVMCNF